MASLNYGNCPCFVGLSKNKKPVDVTEGAIFHEIDTAQDYRYNAKTQSWDKQESNRWWMTYYGI